MNTLAYLGARMKEASSWAGAAGFMLGVMHVSNNAEVGNAIVGVIVALGSLVAVLIPERRGS